jgi:TetR/AcrR family transcriptional repressor of nem operon
MRYSAEHKARTRDKILAEASRIIRQEGAERVSVAALMGRAGLTHGGFYAHFSSKDELVAQAISAMFDDISGRRARLLAGAGPEQALERYLSLYLSMPHCQDRENGCPLPSMMSDLPRMSPPAKAAFGHGVDRIVESIRELLEQMGREPPQEIARAAVSQLAGALALARAVDDREQAQAILASARTALRQLLGLPQPTLN